MSQKDGICMYDKSHTIPIYDKNKEIEERNLNITISNINDILQIKIRDPLEYCFNYTENIDMGDFEVMRLNQNLDINFNEFKFNLIEMLEQFQKREMFIKCEVSSLKSTLIFYCKSKIKSIIYLTIDLHLTNQKEIFSELINNMQSIQEVNERLKKQLASMRRSVAKKDQEIQQITLLKSELEMQFRNNLKTVDNMFNAKIAEFETILVKKIVSTKQRLLKILKDFEVLKRNVIHKSESNKDLLKSMEHLQIEANSNFAMINHLKKENSALHTTNYNQEKCISDLRKNIQEKEGTISELQKRNSDILNDIEKMTSLMAQKKSTIDELSKDLVQANQMLVNFNNHYDNKSKRVEELQATLVAKDETIKRQNMEFNELLKEYQNYKGIFNKEDQDKLKHELFVASNKVDELEKAFRRANKINALLTEKVNHPQQFTRNFDPHP